MILRENHSPVTFEATLDTGAQVTIVDQRFAIEQNLYKIAGATLPELS
jgi:hypothetical protein